MALSASSIVVMKMTGMRASDPFRIGVARRKRLR
jgi:hypothetical protein